MELFLLKIASNISTNTFFSKKFNTSGNTLYYGDNEAVYKLFFASLLKLFTY
jgi:hypothetical protein